MQQRMAFAISFGGLWQTKCGIIWRILNISDRAII